MASSLLIRWRLVILRLQLIAVDVWVFMITLSAAESGACPEQIQALATIRAKIPTAMPMIVFSPEAPAHGLVIDRPRTHGIMRIRTSCQNGRGARQIDGRRATRALDITSKYSAIFYFAVPARSSAPLK